MIKRLKVRTKADRFENDVRASKPKYGRYVYLTLVVAFFLYLGNLVVGPILWLQAEGIVTAERVIVASPYDIQVIKIAVQPGQTVKEGQLIGEVHSPQVTSELASLAARNAETVARQAELSIKLEIANTVIKTATERLAEAETNMRKLAGARALVSDAFYTNAVRERYTAMQERAAREAERRTGSTQVERLAEAQAEAAAAIADLRRRYNDGHVLAPADGVVSGAIARQGDVVRAGDHLAEIYVGSRFVLAYLETGTLYTVRPGQRVKVADGFSRSGGTVTEVLPLTVQLPPEFQNTFRPTSRGQVARIALDERGSFPLSAKVRIKDDTVLPGLTELQGALTRAGEWLRSVTSASPKAS